MSYPLSISHIRKGIKKAKAVTPAVRALADRIKRDLEESKKPKSKQSA
jgi:hypothetical protein